MHTYQEVSKGFHCDEAEYCSLSQLAIIGSKDDPIYVTKKLCDYKRQLRDTQQSEWSYFIVTVDCLAILQKVNVETKADIEEIKDEVNKYLFSTGTSVDDYKVCRVDYCHNIVIDDDKQRQCLFELLNKMRIDTNYLRPPTNQAKMTTDYPMGVLRYNSCRSFQYYDKNSERINNGAIIMPYEKNVLREEYQMMCYSIMYQRKRLKLPDTFDFWLDLDTENYFLVEARKILPKADFWSLDKAIEIINSSDYKPTMKAKLIDYIVEVSKAKRMYKMSPNHPNSQTLKRYVDRLVAINVNPVTIDKKWGFEHIETPMY